MCLTRIYCRRRRDGVLMRFNSKAVMLEYSKANHEGKKTLPVIERSEFIAEKNRYENPTWIHSCQFNGMAMLTEAR
jgi:hypothetical protein